MKRVIVSLAVVLLLAPFAFTDATISDGEFKQVCGNGICEEGEASNCPPCAFQTPPCPTLVACKPGTCQSDCEKPVACTADAKVCPDGTAVGRTGPNCEFAPCPGEEKCDISLCRPFLCCKGETCPLGFPQACGYCSDEICENGNEECENGCPSGEKCLPYGTRKSGEYCSLEGDMAGQKSEGDSCDNSYGCSSNVCVNSKCVSGNLIDKVLNWFRRLFE